ncbi:MAG: hypothetical protein WB495_23365, partial [Xanthobacteraceae bacterium]
PIPHPKGVVPARMAGCGFILSGHTIGPLHEKHRDSTALKRRGRKLAAIPPVLIKNQAFFCTFGGWARAPPQAVSDPAAVRQKEPLDMRFLDNLKISDQSARAQCRG